MNHKIYIIIYFSQHHNTITLTLDALLLMQMGNGTASSVTVLLQQLDGVGLDQMHAKQAVPVNTSKKHINHSVAESRLHVSLYAVLYSLMHHSHPW